MHTVGKIDRDIYKCIAEDIVTDEVIITDNQIQHIKERHPNDYEQFSKYFKEIMAHPDYILKSNMPYSAFMLKHIINEEITAQLILRLQTSTDPDNYKNSIITFLKISQKKLDKYLRNKKILYRRE